MPFFLKLIAIVLSAGLCWLSFPGASYPLLGWVAYLPLALTLTASKRLHNALGFGLFGLVFWCTQTPWLVETIQTRGHAPFWASLALYVLFCVISSIPYVLAGFLMQPGQWWKTPWGPSVQTLIITFCFALIPQLLPVHLGHTQTAIPGMLQVVSYGGSYLLLGLMLWGTWHVGAFLLVRFHMQSWGWSRLLPVVVICCVIMTTGWTQFTQNTEELPVLPTEQVYTIGWVQPNLGPKTPGKLRTLLDLTDMLLLEYPHIDAVIWPEVPIHWYWEEGNLVREKLRSWFQKHSVPVMLNGNQVASEKSRYNALYWIGEDGELRDTFHKLFLVPFGEYAPFRRWFPESTQSWFPRFLNFAPGDKAHVWEVQPGLKIVPSICYDSVFSQWWNEPVEAGGNVLLNISNDAWFGDSHAMDWHLSFSIFRAVEQQRPMLQVTNNGITAHVDSDGRLLFSTKELGPMLAVGTFEIPKT